MEGIIVMIQSHKVKGAWSSTLVCCLFEESPSYQMLFRNQKIFLLAKVFTFSNLEHTGYNSTNYERDFPKMDIFKIHTLPFAKLFRGFIRNIFSIKI